MRYHLRTLLILTSILPPTLAALWLWILPLAPSNYGDAVLLGCVNGTAALLAVMLLQWGWESVTSGFLGPVIVPIRIESKFHDQATGNQTTYNMTIDKLTLKVNEPIDSKRFELRK
jgi:hypothetical protein